MVIVSGGSINILKSTGDGRGVLSFYSYSKSTPATLEPKNIPSLTSLTAKLSLLEKGGRGNYLG